MSQTNFEEANKQLTNTQIHDWQIHKYTIDKYMIESPVDRTFTIGRLGHPAMRKHVFWIDFEIQIQILSQGKAMNENVKLQNSLLSNSNSFSTENVL